ncbi:glycosyl hydrolase [Streptomyces sp. NBC_00513]|uniref:glycoside hydrolase family 26 protein n=1 Tax=Streptomyces sp. NBC_00513 TaxID=2975763 RepID=UPI00225A1C39|nr:glycosyl hydrolase [Streptomyces sp. NBC_00424]MCX5153445.1 glycosyl hydrolase [Streptomyces sp. NBC_00291]WUD41904.1 glycosyl hydrolase [Streptomyces sp. NBC_00513]
MPTPRRRLASTCVGTVTAGLLASGAALAAPDEEAPKGSDIAMGAYLDYGPSGVARIPYLSNWLGGKEIRVGHTYLPGDRWAGIEGNVGFLADWAAWRREDDDRMFVLNVPMQERNEERVSDRQVAQLIRAGAQGDYDPHFKRLAERLVGLGVPDTVIVLGWEMNGTTYTHRCGPDPENWKRYWKRAVAAMRSVPGQKFTFDFAPNRGTDAIGWTKCYPGDDVVDIIGMDSYDQGPGTDFDEQISQPYGLQQHVDFAKAHGKEISYPEWGLFRRGDNPEYVRRMLKWIEQHKPLYHTITDYCPHGVWQCKQNPQSSKVFKEALTPQKPGPVTPTPVVPTPVVPTPVIPTPVVPTPVVPTPQVPTPQIPTPQVPTPQVPTPQIPTPQVPTPQAPSVPPVVPPVDVPAEPSAEPSVETPVSPSPEVPVVEPSPAVPSPAAPSPVAPSPAAPSPLTPVATPEPVEPTTPKPPVNDTQWCVPLNFGEWLSKLVGNQAVCVKLDWRKGWLWPF